MPSKFGITLNQHNTMKKMIKHLFIAVLLLAIHTACDDEMLGDNPEWSFHIYGDHFTDTIFHDGIYEDKILNLNFQEDYNFQFYYQTPNGLDYAAIDADEEKLFVSLSNPSMQFSNSDSTAVTTISSTTSIIEGNSTGEIIPRLPGDLNFYIGYLNIRVEDLNNNISEIRIKTNVGVHLNENQGIQNE